MVIVKHYPFMYENVIIQMITFFMLLMLFIYAPLVNENHPLDEVQYLRNKRNVRFLVFLDALVITFFCVSRVMQGSYLMMFILLNCVLFLSGKLEQDIFAKE